MKNLDLLEKIMAGNMDQELRINLLNIVANKFTDKSEKRTAGIPKLKNCPTRIDCNEVFNRMKSVAGGTGVGVARILGISSQGVNNQISRNTLSGNSLLNFHFRTGISLDWLAGSWTGDTSDYYLTDFPGRSKAGIPGDDRPQKYLSLVETYNQISGVVELKWCLTKRHVCLDNDNLPVPEDFGALYSLILRYRGEAGTPARVRSGNQHNFQVRRVIAYILGDAKLVRRIDGFVKKQTAEHVSGNCDRPGKTEFRHCSSKEECLNVFSRLALKGGWELVTGDSGF